MVAERQDKYPKGTYKLLITTRPDGRPLYHLTNLVTRQRSCCPSIWKMLNALDNDLTANRYPQKTVQYRTWEVKKHMKDSIVDTPTDFTAPAGAGPTFVIRVLFRQNATWQGSIQWIEGKQTRQFRSEYEMLHLMDEAMQSSIADTTQTNNGWDNPDHSAQQD